jgi:nucleoside-diphosphate-sugar epimerase
MRNREPRMKVLLTGGFGNLGHTLAPMLLDRGDIPVILDVVSVRNSGTQVWPFWISASGRGAVSFRKGTDASNPADRLSQLMRRVCRLFPHHSD